MRYDPPSPEHLTTALTMSQSPQDSSWNLLGPLVTEYSFVVHCISLVCFCLGLLFLIPITVLIILDLFLWVWRMYRTPTPPNERHGHDDVVVVQTALPDAPAPVNRRTR
ncbi:hypothetical protein BGZ61DRAFT_530637 [Ilyonectria robusta]|uniref:uncharacterized protein n=1 Tax=Ilyonectria robusta TaxID=1079257 RepID=UPI001E8D81A4|nr:uncharacterized protein BGZ61DRAFT_530637 [Ilyonectria robusta]KAH8722180.1 hypothetical protein BGZ61DRAFT_530637 [Ilyonectria robusta]